MNLSFFSKGAVRAPFWLRAFAVALAVLWLLLSVNRVWAAAGPAPDMETKHHDLSQVQR